MNTGELLDNIFTLLNKHYSCARLNQDVYYPLQVMIKICNKASGSEISHTTRDRSRKKKYDNTLTETDRATLADLLTQLNASTSLSHHWPYYVNLFNQRLHRLTSFVKVIETINSTL